jgi:hypothetical protein
LRRVHTQVAECDSRGPPVGESKSNRQFDQRVVASTPRQFEGHPRKEWWLRKKTRSRSMVELRCMHQEWVTQEHRSCRSRRGSLRHSFRGARGCKAQLHHRQPVFSNWSQQWWNPKMRSQPNPCRCVVLADVRKQKQHEQSSPFRSQIDAPIEVRSRGLDRLIGRKACVQMPPCISRVVGVRKPDWKSAQALPRNPSTHANQFVEGGMQCGRIH